MPKSITIRKLLRGAGPLLAFLALFAAPCPPAAAEVTQPNGEYREEVEELRVQVLGGPIRLTRDYLFDRWQVNSRWNPLQFTYDNLDGSVKTIERNSAIYLRQGDGWVFDKRTLIRKESVRVLVPGQGEGSAPASLIGTTPAATLAGGLATTTEPGYRWLDRTGNWIDYDRNGRLVAYGDRNDVRVWLEYGSGEADPLQKVRDHFGRTVLAFTWSGGQITEIRDNPNLIAGDPTPARSVRYTWSDGKLMSAIDVLGHASTFTYAGKRLATRTDPEQRTRTITYGPTGRVDSVQEADGTQTKYAYDYDKLKRTFYLRTTYPATAAGSKVEEAWYDADGKVVRRDVNGRTQTSVLIDPATKTSASTDAQGRKTITTRDEFDNVVRTEYPDGSVTSAKVGLAHGQAVEEIDELGVKTAYAYDAKGNRTSVTEAVGLPEQRVTETMVDAFGQRTGVIRPGEAITRFTYDNFGNVARVTDAEGGITETTYNRLGLATQLTDPRGNVWTSRHDARGNLVESRDPLNAVIAHRYNKVGEHIETTEPGGAVTVFGYDPAGRPTSVTDALGGVRRQTYDARGRLVETIDENGKLLSRDDYDLDDRLVRSTDGAGNVTEFVYDADGQQSEIIYPTFRRRFTFDSRGRLVDTTDALDASTTFSTRSVFDRKGQIVERIDRNGQRTLQAYDNLGRMIGITDSANGSTSFSYDGRDNPQTVTDAMGNTHRIEYDLLDRRTKEIRPLGEMILSAYDANGNLVTRTDAMGNVIRHIYDAADRPTREERIPAGLGTPTRIIDNTYDAAGHLIGYTDMRAGQIVSGASYTLDALGRTTAEALSYGATQYSFGSVFAANGQLTQQRYPDGSAVDYTYDAGRRLATVSTAAGVVTIGSYAWTQPNNISLPGGQQTRSYDALGRLTRIEQKDPAQNPLLDYAYSLDPEGNITQKATEHGSYTYRYDSLYRLTQANQPAPLQSETWTYDAVGNRLTDSTTGSNPWRYNGNNQLLEHRNKAGQAVLHGFDANGSQIETRNASDQTTPTTDNLTSVYDEANRLVEVKDAQGQTVARYDYDPFGRRIGKTVFQRPGSDGRYQALATPETVWFVYGEEGLLAEADAQGNLIATYGWKPDGLWGTDPLFRREGATTGWFLNDHLGTPQKLIDGRGKVLWAGKASAFGETIVGAEATMSNPLRFPGQYFDVETEAHQNYFRDYSPQIGRYVQSDPIGFDGDDNPYLYVYANPLTLIDEHGLAAWMVPAVIIGCKIIIKGWKTYNNIKKARKALARTCGVIHTGYSAACKYPGCDQVVSCEDAKQRLRMRVACSEGRRLYIKSNCDSVGRGYGARGKETPTHLANHDRNRHEEEYKRSLVPLEKCKQKARDLCKCENLDGDCFK